VSERHEFNRVEREGDELVLVCECGARSPASRDAVDVGGWWDHHRRANG